MSKFLKKQPDIKTCPFHGHPCSYNCAMSVIVSDTEDETEWYCGINRAETVEEGKSYSYEFHPVYGEVVA